MFHADYLIVSHHSHKKNSPATINVYYSQAQFVLDSQIHRRLHVLEAFCCTFDALLAHRINFDRSVPIFARWSLGLNSAGPDGISKTATPIKHVIVIIGENRSFDHVFATYVPKGNQKVWNLLSQGIVKADGTPGPNFDKAHQRAAVDLGEKKGGDPFLMSPPKLDFGGDVLPAPLVGGAKDSYIPSDSLTLAEETENGLAR